MECREGSMVEEAANLGIRGGDIELLLVLLLLERVSIPAVSRECSTSLEDHGNCTKSLVGSRW
jgi:hypothetical protein